MRELFAKTVSCGAFVSTVVEHLSNHVYLCTCTYLIKCYSFYAEKFSHILYTNSELVFTEEMKSSSIPNHFLIREKADISSLKLYFEGYLQCN